MPNHPLHDRFRVRYWLRFLLFFAAFFVPAFLGLQAAGSGRWATAWVIMAVTFFGFVLPAILCRHCPHHARKGRFIVCPSAVGPPKLLRYSSKPVSRPEKALFIAGFAGILAFPLPFILASGRYLWAALALIGAGLFFYSEQRFSCSRCLNFSCVLNRVPADVRTAWEQGHEAENPRQSSE